MIWPASWDLTYILPAICSSSYWIVQDRRYEDRRRGIKKQEGGNGGKGEENRISDGGRWDGNVSSFVWETVSSISLTLANRHLNCWIHTHTHIGTATQRPHLASVGRPPQESAATDYTWNHPWCVCLAFVNVCVCLTSVITGRRASRRHS